MQTVNTYNPMEMKVIQKQNEQNEHVRQTFGGANGRNAMPFIEALATMVRPYPYSPNYSEFFSYRPEVSKTWQNSALSTYQHLRLRRYELVTLFAMRALMDIYPAQQASLLENREEDEAELEAIAEDYRYGLLAPDEVAVMKFAEKILTKSGHMTRADVNRLKNFGISDAEILDIILMADAHAFFGETRTHLPTP